VGCVSALSSANPPDAGFAQRIAGATVPVHALRAWIVACFGGGTIYPITRRTALAAAAAMTVAPATARAVNPNDAELARLSRAFHCVGHQKQAFLETVDPGSPDAEDHVNKVYWPRMWAAYRAMCDIPADSLQGVMSKLRVVLLDDDWRAFAEGLDLPHGLEDEPLLRSAFRDIARLGGAAQLTPE
jgi:hypothetical protein